MGNKPFIESVINASGYKDGLRAVLSDHFDELKNPVSVSMGLYPEGKRVDETVSLLRLNGINAVPYYHPDAKDLPDAFIVDGTGLRTPFFTPEDAVKAVADVYEIMRRNGIPTSRALPVAKENLIPALTRTYDGKIIDIGKNNPNDRDAVSFTARQLEFAQKEMEPVSPKSGRLYRGGTLGGNPYAMTFHRRQRDAVYATRDFATAATYADGIKGAGLRYKEADGIPYGFIYEFEELAGQKFYGMAGVERPDGSEECVGHPDNKDDYETLILPDRNPLTAVYLKAGEKIVRIADEKGYVSPEWEKFAHLHTPYDVSEKNDHMAERMNRLVSGFSVVPYEKSDAPLTDGYADFRPDIRGLVFSGSIKNRNGKREIANAEFSALALPEDLETVRFTGDFFMDGCLAPRKLDLSKCTGVVGLSNCDLSRTETVDYPEKCGVFFLSNVKLPEHGTVDFGKMKCDYLTLENQNCSGLDKLLLPSGAQIKIKGDTVLPQNKDPAFSTTPEKKPLMTALLETDRNRKDKIAAALTDEFVADVQKRFAFLSSLNAKALETYENNPVLREEFLNTAEQRPDFSASVLEKLYKNNPAKIQELGDCCKARDFQRINALYETAKRDSPEETAKIRKEKGKWMFIGPHGDQALFQEKMSVLKSQTNRYDFFDGSVEYEGKTEDLHGYCAQGILLSLYKMKSYYGENVLDFMPDAKQGLKPAGFIEATKESGHLYETGGTGKFNALAEEKGFQTGTVVVALTKSGRPQHMMMLEKRENGASLLMGFNDDKKGTNADKFNSIAIDVPAMIRQSVSKLSGKELDALEQKMKVPLSQRDWSDTLAESRKYSPEKQWSEYYRRSDVKDETARRIAESKARLLSNRKNNGR